VEEGEEGAGEGGDSWSWCWDTSVSALIAIGKESFGGNYDLSLCRLSCRIIAGLGEARQGSDDARITTFQGSAADVALLN
jgi:hypothetical protein